MADAAILNQGRRPAIPASRTPRFRSKGGIHPGRISSVRNVETPTRPGPAGRPDVRRAQLLSGKRRPKKRRPAAERQRESITGWIERLLRRKPADVGLVNYPKDAVKVAHRGTS